MSIKGKKTRSEMGGGITPVTISDMDAQKTWVLGPGTRSYTEIDFAAVKAATPASSASKPKLASRKTGRTDKVLVQRGLLGMRFGLCCSTRLAR